MAKGPFRRCTEDQILELLAGMFSGSSTSFISEQSGLSRQAVNRNLKQIRVALFEHAPFLMEDCADHLIEPDEIDIPFIGATLGKLFQDMKRRDISFCQAIVHCARDCPVCPALEISPTGATPVERLPEADEEFQSIREIEIFSERVEKKRYCRLCPDSFSGKAKNFFLPRPELLRDFASYFSDRRIRDESHLAHYVTEAFLISSWKLRSRGIYLISSSSEEFQKRQAQFKEDFVEFLQAAYMRLWLVIHNPDYQDSDEYKSG